MGNEDSKPSGPQHNSIINNQNSNGSRHNTPPRNTSNTSGNNVRPELCIKTGLEKKNCNCNQCIFSRSKKTIPSPPPVAYKETSNSNNTHHNLPTRNTPNPLGTASLIEAGLRCGTTLLEKKHSKCSNCLNSPPKKMSLSAPPDASKETSKIASLVTSSAETTKANEANCEICPNRGVPRSACNCLFCDWEKESAADNLGLNLEDPKKSVDNGSISATLVDVESEKSGTSLKDQEDSSLKKFDPISFVKGSTEFQKTENSVEKTVSDETQASDAEVKGKDLFVSKRIGAPSWMHKFILDHGELKQALVSVSKIIVFSDEKNIKLEGDAEAVKRIEEIIQKLLLEIPTQKTIFEQEVDSTFYKFIIGKEGKILNKIRADTKTEIQVPGTNSKSKIITIIGDIPEVDKAWKQIKKIIEEAENKLGASCVELRIKRRFHKMLIGPKGADVKSISNVSGANIHFPKEREISHVVTLKGTTIQIEKAKQLLKNALKKIKERQGIEDLDSEEEQEAAPRQGSESFNADSMHDAIIEHIRCKRCTELMQPPIFMCESEQPGYKGHNVCESCKISHALCVCGQPIRAKRNFQLENLAAKVKAPCKHRSLGCDFRGAASDLKAHEDDACRYAAKYFCKNRDRKCAHRGFSTAADLAEHEKICIYSPKIHCRYRDYGCEVTDLQEAVTVHEKRCLYLDINCPISMNESSENPCRWVGYYEHLKKHAEKRHSFFLQAADKGEILNRDLMRFKKFESILICAHGELFQLLCTNKSVASDVVFSARCFNPSFLDARFLFKVEFVDKTGKGLTFGISQICNPFSTDAQKPQAQLSIPRKLLEPYISQNTVYFKIRMFET